MFFCYAGSGGRSTVKAGVSPSIALVMLAPKAQQAWGRWSAIPEVKLPGSAFDAVAAGEVPRRKAGRSAGAVAQRRGCSWRPICRTATMRRRRQAQRRRQATPRRGLEAPAPSGGAAPDCQACRAHCRVSRDEHRDLAASISVGATSSTLIWLTPTLSTPISARPTLPRRTSAEPTSARPTSAWPPRGGDINRIGVHRLHLLGARSSFVSDLPRKLRAPSASVAGACSDRWSGRCGPRRAQSRPKPLGGSSDSSLDMSNAASACNASAAAVSRRLSGSRSSHAA
jgi:hypothetical protein